MANGKVVIDTELNTDGLEKGLGKLSGAGGGGKGGLFGTLFKSGLAVNAVTGAFNAIKSGFGAITGEMNDNAKAWKTFDGNMQMIGKTPSEIMKVKSSLQDFATETIYSASDMASTYAQMAAIGTENTEQLVKGMGGIAASSEQPAQAMRTLSQQMTQALTKPNMQWMDFKLMLEQAPAGMAMVAEHMGMSLDELVLAIQDGEVASADFAQAIAEVGTNDHFSKMATQYKTMDQAMDGLTETISNKLAPAFDAVSDIGIKAISGIADWIDGIDFSGLTRGIENIGKGLVRMFDFGKKLISVIGQIGSAFGQWVSPVQDFLNNFFKPMSQGFENIKQDFRLLGSGIKGAFELISKGDWSGAWQRIVNSTKLFASEITKEIESMATGMKDSLFKAFDATNWRELGSNVMKRIGEGLRSAIDTIGQIGSNIRDWIFEQTNTTSWGELGSKIMQGIGQSINDGIHFIGDIGGNIQDFIFGSLGAQSWGEVAGIVGDAINGALQAGIDITADIASDIFSWASEQIESVDWESVGTALGNLVGDAINGAAEFIQNTIDGTFDFDWSSIEEAILSANEFIDAAFEAVDEVVVSAMEGLVESITGYEWGDISSAFETLWEKLEAIEFTGDFGDLIEQIGTAFGEAFKNINLNDFMPEFKWHELFGDKVWQLDWNTGEFIEITGQPEAKFQNTPEVEVNEINTEVSPSAEVDAKYKLEARVDSIFGTGAYETLIDIEAKSKTLEFYGESVGTLQERIDEEFGAGSYEALVDLGVIVDNVIVDNIEDKVQSEIPDSVDAELVAKVEAAAEVYAGQGFQPEMIKNLIDANFGQGTYDTIIGVNADVDNLEIGQVPPAKIDKADGSVAQLDITANSSKVDNPPNPKIGAMTADVDELKANPGMVSAGQGANELAKSEGLQLGNSMGLGMDEGVGKYQFTQLEGMVSSAMASLNQSFRSGFETIKVTAGEAMTGVGNQMNMAIGQINLSSSLATLNAQFRTGLEQMKMTVLTWGTGLSAQTTIAMQQMQLAIQTSLTTIQTQFQTRFISINNTVIAQMNAIESSVTTGMSSIQTNVNSNLTTIQSNVQTRMNSIKNTVTGGMNSIKSSVTTGMSSIKSSVDSGLISVQSAFQSRMNSIKNTVTGGMNAVVAAFNSAIGPATSAGASVGEGFRNGLASMRASIVNTAQGIANAVSATIRSALSIHSPSRVTTKLGEQTGEGLWVGLDNERRNVEKSSLALAESAIPPINPTQFMGTGIGTTLGGTSTGGVVSQVTLYVDKFINNTKDDLPQLVENLRFYEDRRANMSLGGAQ